MQVFLKRALEDIRKCTSYRKHTSLRSSIDTVLKDLQEIPSSNTEEDAFYYADAYVYPLAQACETRHVKCTEIALDCIEKLMAYGYIKGTGPCPIPMEEGDTFMDYIVHVIFLCNDHQEVPVQRQVIKALVVAVSNPTCTIHGKSLLNAVRACYHIHLVSKDVINQAVAKATLQQMLHVVFSRMESYDTRMVSAISQGGSIDETVATRDEYMYPSVLVQLGFKMSTTSDDDVTAGEVPVIISLPPPIPLTLKSIVPSTPTTSVFPSACHKDAYLIFRSLCKLSMKDIPESGESSMAVQSNVLALDLILSVVDNSGPTFRSAPPFIHLVKEYLCVSLIQNSVSSFTPLIHLSLQIFVSLMKQFKVHLKDQIQTFLSDICLRILESANSPFKLKSIVLSAMLHITSDDTMLGEIFLNYDCDPNAIDLFQRIVHALAKSAKGSVHASNSSSEVISVLDEERLTQHGALECLIAIASSLKVAWTPSGVASSAATSVVEENDDEIISPDVLSTPPSSMGLSVVEAFDRKQKVQSELSSGILKFNVKPSNGIKYLIEKGHLENTPLSVATFLHDRKSELNMTQVGEYLGKEQAYQGGFCIAVLHEYVDTMSFTTMDFDVAIRHYLSGFRLPGEAQKIDRMMEKFAERFCLNNPDVFPSPDTAFILAFSVIMLQTDLHNPSVREDRKMTRDGFVKNNRGINAGNDLPSDFLGAIYDRILNTPISLKEDTQSSLVDNAPSTSMFFSTVNVDRVRKEVAFQIEKTDMVLSSQARLKQHGEKLKTKKESGTYVSDFYSIRDVYVEHVLPMFQLLWAPLLASCSVLLETWTLPSHDDVVLCMNGFELAIHLSGVLRMESVRNAYVTSLAKFSGLLPTRQHSIRMKKIEEKQLEGIKALLRIAMLDGSYLQDAWCDILSCISQLARLQNHAQGMHSEDAFFNSPPPPVTPPSTRSSFSIIASTPTNITSSPSSSSSYTRHPSSNIPNLMEEWNAGQLMNGIDLLATDRVFSKSVSLADDAIESFVQNLCIVSLTELSTSSSVYSLQKLVEVADMNMNTRPRMVWSRVWEILGRHFTTIGCHENHSVAMYAIDSLRQLSTKFLEKQELTAFNFQRRFLQPFETIMSNSPSTEIKELILKCVESIVLTKGGDIKSGWKSILSVFAVASSDDTTSVVQLSCDLLLAVLRDHFEYLTQVFPDVIDVLLQLASYPPTQQGAIAGLGICGKGLGTKCVAVPSTGDVFGEADVNLWWPLLTGLAGILKGDPDVVRAVLPVLFNDVLMEEGQHFTPELLSLVFQKILFPLMNELKAIEYMATVAETWKAIVTLYATYYTTLPPYMFTEILDRITKCITLEITSDQRHGTQHTLSNVGVSCLDILLVQTGKHFEPSRWKKVLVLLKTLMETMCPFYLMEMDVSMPLRSTLTTTTHAVQTIDDFVSKEPNALDKKKHRFPNMYKEVQDVLLFQFNHDEQPHQQPQQQQQQLVSSHVTKITTPTRELHTMLSTTTALQRLVGSVVVSHAAQLTEDQLTSCINLVANSYVFAQTFNEALPLREALATAGFHYPNNPPTSGLPNMLPQELAGKEQYCRILLHLTVLLKPPTSNNVLNHHTASLTRYVSIYYYSLV